MLVKFFKIFFIISLFFLVVANLYFVVGYVYAADQGWKLEVKIPGTEAEQSFTNPGEYIRKIYLTGAGIAAVLAVAVIVWAGFVWMTAPAIESLEEAKKRIWGAIAGLILLLASWLILYTINPELVSLNPPGLEGLNLGTTDAFDNLLGGGGGGGTGDGTGGGGSQQTSGDKDCPEITEAGHPCSVENLKKYFGSNAVYASRICFAESGGVSDGSNLTAGGMCNGQSTVWGLFQVNIGANSIGGLDCPSAFSNYTSEQRCRVTNQGLYNQCVTAAKNTELNIRKAAEMSGGGNNWGAWSTAIIANESGGQHGAGPCYGHVPVR